MQLSTLLRDDDAVSPVIGVILMVAITVILAAVIGTFVLNTKPDTQDAPSVNWDYDWDGSTLTVAHNGGDRIEADRIRIVRGDGTVLAEKSSHWSGQTYLTSGWSVHISSGVSDGTTVKILWNAAQAQQSNVIGSHTLAET